MILVSHNIVICKDKKYPTLISKTWHDILRNDLKFTGLILTDDLSMAAIKEYNGDLSPAILAVNAGNDILLTSDYYIHLNAVTEAVKNKTISEETINTACRRVIAWKLKYLMGRKGDSDNSQDEGGISLVLIISLVIVGVIIIGIILFFLFKYVLCKAKSNDENSEQLCSLENRESN
jgi:beta-glucosidase-like glycosyl hydrolase